MRDSNSDRPSPADENRPTRTKACAYLRSSARDDNWLQIQRKRLLDLAKREGYEVIDWYADEGYSGADRPRWRKLLADAPTAVWTVVLCLNRERFCRLSDAENGMATRIMQEAGKKLHTAIEGALDWHATAGEIIAQMIDAEEGKDGPSFPRTMDTH